MKQKICGCPEAKKLLMADKSLERQIAKTIAQLRRIHRSLLVMDRWNRKLFRAVQSLLQNIARDGKLKDAFKESNQLSEWCARYDSLTPRERQVMACVVSGSPNKHTAAQLGTAEITIKVHRANVMKKMKASSIVDLVRMAEKMRTSLSPMGKFG
jgi:DNA-binding NarL/FixJ family response regulator